MRQLITAVVIIFVMSIISLAKPQLSVSELRWNFGNIPANSILIHDFWIKNTGTDTLKLIDVKPGFGCKFEPISKTELAPGDSTIVKLICNTQKYGGDFHNSAVISCNDSDRAKLGIHFDANILRSSDSVFPVRFKPEKMALKKGKSRYALKIENLDSNMVNLAEIGVVSRNIKATVAERVIKPGKPITIYFEWNGGRPDYDENIIATFDKGLKGESRFSIPFTILGTNGQNPIVKPIEIPDSNLTTPRKEMPVINIMDILKNMNIDPGPNATMHKRANPDSTKAEKPSPEQSQPPK